MIHKRISTLRDYLRIWFTWKYYGVGAAAVIVAVTALYLALAAPVYTARARVVLLPRTGEGTVITAGTEEKRLYPVSVEDINTAMEIMRSDDLRRQVIDEWKQRGRQPALTAREFDAALGIKAIPVSNIIEISLRQPSPHIAADLLNLYVDLYINHHNAVFTVKQSVDFYGAQADTFQKQLDTTETRLRSFEARHNIIDLEKQNARTIESISRIENELHELDQALAETNRRVSLLSDALAQDPEQIALNREMRSIPLLAELDKAIAPLLVRRSELLARYTPQSPDVADIQKRIDAVFQERIREIQRALNGERMEAATLEARRQPLINELERLRRVAANYSRQALAIADMRRTAELQRQNFMLYAGKTEDARIISERLARNMSNISVADRADPPAEPSSPKILLTLIVAVFLSLFVVVVLPFVLEIFDQRIKNGADVEALLGLPVIAALPLQRSDGDETAALQALARYVSNGFAATGPRTLSIVGADPNVDVTELLIKLARTLTQLPGTPGILIVDARSQPPGAHRLLQAPGTLGLREYAAGMAQPAAVIHQSATDPSIRVTPLGEKGPKLWAEALPGFIDTQKENARFILIAAPSFDESSETIAVARASAMVLLAAACHSSRLKAVERAAQLLTSAKRPVDGVALVGWRRMIPSWLYQLV